MGHSTGRIWTDEDRRRIRRLKEDGKTWGDIAAEFGATFDSVRAAVRGPVPSADTTPQSAPQAEQPPELHGWGIHRQTEALRKQLDEERRRRKAAEDECETAEARQAVIDALHSAEHVADPFVPSGRPSKARNRAIPVFMLSDWHVEEVVDPAAISGANEYTPDIARARISRVFRGIDWLVKHWRNGWDIKEALLWFGGDLITGFLHDDQRESNAMHPTEAMLMAQALVEAGVLGVLKSSGLERVRVAFNYGNHGRTSEKPRVATAAKNSFEWLMGRELEQRFEHEPRVELTVSSGALLYQPVAGHVIRFLHGNEVVYSGGVGGLTIPLRKSVDAWDTYRRADLTCLGHYHAYQDLGYAVVNGSVIGYSAYAQDRCKARFEPPRQAAFLIDEDRGKSIDARIWCDEPKRATA